MSDHPFITAVQAALNTHGLPDGVTRVSAAKHAWSNKPAFYVSIGHDVCESGDTLADAYDKALTLANRLAALRSDEAAKAEARKMLVAAGLDPKLIAA